MTLKSVRNLLIAILLAFPSMALAGDVSIISKEGTISVEYSMGGKFWPQSSLKQCNFANPFKNLIGQCDGIRKFTSNPGNQLFVRFSKGPGRAFTQNYTVESGKCYLVNGYPAEGGLALIEGCPHEEDTAKLQTPKGTIPVNASLYTTGSAI